MTIKRILEGTARVLILLLIFFSVFVCCSTASTKDIKHLNKHNKFSRA